MRLEDIIEDAREDAREEGRENGVIEGREKGREEYARETAMRMKEDGTEMQRIIRYTGLSEEEIRKLPTTKFI